ncbi:hypothetical protein BDY21DRAFT_365137 [Lineolata rhizophorae]|uniref:Uncharacterized protein n=1 Tax=Lineolata rhizophorae TaxID=578093 RepID=A0A6A6NVX0_9PEZI|nr:hypothetical protein BDY21DRAFT_365137 [Lineolata rhizophorae]
MSNTGTTQSLSSETLSTAAKMLYAFMSILDPTNMSQAILKDALEKDLLTHLQAPNRPRAIRPFDSVKEQLVCHGFVHQDKLTETLQMYTSVAESVLEIRTVGPWKSSPSYDREIASHVWTLQKAFGDTIEDTNDALGKDRKTAMLFLRYAKFALFAGQMDKCRRVALLAKCVFAFLRSRVNDSRYSLSIVECDHAISVALMHTTPSNTLNYAEKSLAGLAQLEATSENHTQEYALAKARAYNQQGLCQVLANSERQEIISSFESSIRISVTTDQTLFRGALPATNLARYYILEESPRRAEEVLETHGWVQQAQNIGEEDDMMLFFEE